MAQIIGYKLTPEDYPHKPLSLVGDPAHVFFHKESKTWARITIEIDGVSCVNNGYPSYEAAMANDSTLVFYRENPMPDWLN